MQVDASDDARSCCFFFSFPFNSRREKKKFQKGFKEIERSVWLCVRVFFLVWCMYSSTSLKAVYRRALANEKLRDFDAALVRFTVHKISFSCLLSIYL